MDHIEFFTIREEAPQEVVEVPVSSVRALGDEVPSTIDLSGGETFSDRIVVDYRS